MGTPGTVPWRPRCPELAAVRCWAETPPRGPPCAAALVLADQPAPRPSRMSLAERVPRRSRARRSVVGAPRHRRRDWRGCGRGLSSPAGVAPTRSCDARIKRQVALRSATVLRHRHSGSDGTASPSPPTGEPLQRCGCWAGFSGVSSPSGGRRPRSALTGVGSSACYGGVAGSRTPDYPPGLKRDVCKFFGLTRLVEWSTARLTVGANCSALRFPHLGWIALRVRNFRLWRWHTIQVKAYSGRPPLQASAGDSRFLRRSARRPDQDQQLRHWRHQRNDAATILQLVGYPRADPAWSPPSAAPGTTAPLVFRPSIARRVAADSAELTGRVGGGPSIHWNSTFDYKRRPQGRFRGRPGRRCWSTWWATVHDPHSCFGTTKFTTLTRPEASQVIPVGLLHGARS